LVQSVGDFPKARIEANFKHRYILMSEDRSAIDLIFLLGSQS
jgi:hypothetical protein